MNSLQWIELYQTFEKFAVIARKNRFYTPTLEQMEESLFNMCPMPHKWRYDCKKDDKE